MEKSVFLTSGIDRVFVDCLREIERSYVHLPKQARIRIEKWVEKLVSTGRNVVWQKHRNAYAKLLLNMVMTGNLTDPFHALPPDGPLPTFPHHLKSYTKNLLGAHESAFWHELYNRVNMHDEKSEPVEEKITEKAPVKEKTDVASAQKEEVRSSKELTTLPQSREIQNLNFLIKEQSRRIQLLEEQLHSERTQHELQLQRLQYTHRIEIGTLRNELYKVSNAGHSMAGHNSTLDLDYSRASPIKSSGLPFSQSATRRSPTKSSASATESYYKSPSGANRSKPGSSSSVRSSTVASESRYGLGSTVGASTVTLPAPSVAGTAAAGPGATITSGSTATLDSVFDLTHSTARSATHTAPSAPAGPMRNTHVPGSPPLHPPRPVPEDPYDSLSSYSAHAEIIPHQQQRPRTHSGSSASVTSNNASPGNNAEDREFMAYISQFQREINKISHTLQSSMHMSSPSSLVESPNSGDGVAGLGQHQHYDERTNEQPLTRSEFSD